MSQTPRRINTDRSLKQRPAAGTARPAAAGQTVHSGGQSAPPPRRPSGNRSEPPRRRRKKKKTPLWLPFAVVMAVVAVVSGVVVYGVSVINKV